ncbi:NAD(P)-dependent alcohol dehydrogenase [Rhizobium sp. C4]|uniref:NAD(P)-dependent alcohol dehydrogenase n=1 Tax=Rhizobium sp. C4 TaxID=1349800 RepID=UPI001E3C9B4A|nr:NAD(P)-dependent alcohol dehydrogenase [Rhizobium sp. C4]MCD2173858.1 NAD(P)-dependent alcohol dehydrogenase [Rhizobium sp. C4]
MQALVLEEKGRLSLRDYPVSLELGPYDVRIAIHTVGICGSDVHYYTHGKIGPFVVKEPMILGHEAAGTITAVGAEVSHLKVGDRVCMEPGIPDLNSKAVRLGMYNVDPAVRFWATPPVNGCLTPEVVHPAAFTFKLPDNVSFAEGAMVEPLAVGIQAALKAGIKPGDTAVVMGAGPIGMITALSALAGGCSRVIVSDVAQPKLDIIGAYPGVETVNVRNTKLVDYVRETTEGWGADIVFEASGAAPAVLDVANVVAPGGTCVMVGMPVDPVPVDIVGLQAKEATLKTIFRYANVYDRAIALIASGKIDLKPLITETFAFGDSVAAFDRAVEARPTDVKLQIVL